MYLNFDAFSDILVSHHVNIPTTGKMADFIIEKILENDCFGTVFNLICKNNYC